MAVEPTHDAGYVFAYALGMPVFSRYQIYYAYSHPSLLTMARTAWSRSGTAATAVVAFAVISKIPFCQAPLEFVRFVMDFSTKFYCKHKPCDLPWCVHRLGVMLHAFVIRQHYSSSYLGSCLGKMCVCTVTGCTWLQVSDLAFMRK